MGFRTVLPVQAPFTPTHYVSLEGSNIWPYTTWATAASNIQDAVDVAVDGDRVVVSNGVYIIGGAAVYGNLTNRVAITKAVTLESVNGAEVTSIVGQGPLGGNATRCAYVGSNAVLRGFTLTGGHTLISGDLIEEASGGGALCEPLGQVEACIITGNAASEYGGGVYGGTLANCIIYSNTAHRGGRTYGSTVRHSTVCDNSATYGGGTYLGTLENCIVYFNSAVADTNWSGGALSYCCTVPDPGGVGVVTNNPSFMDHAARDYHLSYTSSCINAGMDVGVIDDIEGNPRPLPKYYGGSSRADLGAYEHAPAARFVSPSGGNVAPYERWVDAANSIQAAVNASGGGDLIVVFDGSYVLTSGVSVADAVTIWSLNGPTKTTIDGDNTYPCVSLNAAGAILDGFTVVNGYSSGHGGGIALNGGLVQNCVVANGSASGNGGGIYNVGGTVYNCSLLHNSAYHGAGIYSDGGTIRDCDISFNSGAGGWGGGVYAENGSTVRGCMITHNTNDSGGGVYCDLSYMEDCSYRITRRTVLVVASIRMKQI